MSKITIKAHKGNRAKNLESIADTIDTILKTAEIEKLEGYEDRINIKIGGGDVRRIRGYMEQLRIIADEDKMTGTELIEKLSKLTDEERSLNVVHIHTEYDYSQSSIGYEVEQDIDAIKCVKDKIILSW